jgi:hypothetical protein
MCSFILDFIKNIFCTFQFPSTKKKDGSYENRMEVNSVAICGLPRAGREIGRTFLTNPTVCCVGELSAQRGRWPSSLGIGLLGVRGLEPGFQYL